MGAWITQHWFDLLQSVGIVSGFIFTAYSIRKEDVSRRIGNLLAIAERHHSIWKLLYERPGLSRIMDERAALETKPLSDEEQVFITAVILHLDTVHQASKEKMFVRLERIREDVRHFFSLPIPRAAWNKLKPFQDVEFVEVVEDCLASSNPVQ